MKKRILIRQNFLLNKNRRRQTSPVLGNHNTGIKNYSSIVIFLQKKYNTGIKSYSSIVNNTVRK